MGALAFIAALLVWRWLVRLGGLGLILLGIADNSVVPLTGSMDVLTIWLAAKHRDIWPYYAAMATTGAVLGGYITYSLGRRGGKEAIHRKINPQRAEKVFNQFNRWGFRTVALTAMLPPPFPMLPVLLAAGALQYPRKKFIGALAFGRSVRYFLIAGVGSLYAREIAGFFNRYYKLALFTLIGLAIIGSMVALGEYLRLRARGHREGAVGSSRAA
ncbi:MAG: VTT domain-containing protein [Acidobacteria bacterium]|nr:VTT domain-containing protein [Acidobacteriota bacterium]